MTHLLLMWHSSLVIFFHPRTFFLSHSLSLSLSLYFSLSLCLSLSLSLSLSHTLTHSPHLFSADGARIGAPVRVGRARRRRRRTRGALRGRAVRGQRAQSKGVCVCVCFFVAFSSLLSARLRAVSRVYACFVVCFVRELCLSTPDSICELFASRRFDVLWHSLQ